MTGELLLAAALVQDRPRDPDPICRPDVRWMADTTRAVSRSGPGRSLALFAALGGANGPCGPAGVSLTVAYVDEGGSVLCSGVVTNVAPLSSPTQVLIFDLRPGTLLEFVRWRNAGQAPRLAVPLTCRSSDGTSELPIELPIEALQTAETLRVWATVTSRYNGIASDELVLALAP